MSATTAHGPAARRPRRWRWRAAGGRRPAGRDNGSSGVGRDDGSSGARHAGGAGGSGGSGSVWTGVLLALLLAAAGGFVAGERTGWRVLAAPAERWLSSRLGLPVDIAHAAADDFRLSLWRGVRLQARGFRIGSPAWAGDAPLLQADGVQLQARWRDLLFPPTGRPLTLQRLSAERLQAHLVRDADGRANWAPVVAGAASTPAAAASAAALPRLPLDPGRVWARQAQVVWRDAPLRAEVLARLHLGLPDTNGLAPLPDAASAPTPPNPRDPATPADTPSAEAIATADAGAAWPQLALAAVAEGRYQGQPLSLSLRTGPLAAALGVAPSAAPVGAAPPPAAPALALQLGLKAGRAALRFDGRVTGPLGPWDLLGRYTLSGPSLAAVGQPLGVTLPTTAAFAMQGRLAKQGSAWHVVVDEARIGRSRLDAALRFDTAAARRRLDGRVHARHLALADLGPTIGTPTAETPSTTRAPGRVLPDRRFDLPALNAMDANVLLSADRLDLGSAALKDVAPLHAQLLLDQGRLQLRDLDARLAQGRIRGDLALDGRGGADRPAQWQARLRGSGLRLEQWVQAVQRPGQPPYASGRLGLQLNLQGQGRSTAELLASADGRVMLHWTQGTLSHLLVEAAGLDIAQGLGVLLRGDDNLAVRCGLADLAVQDGRLRPKAFVVDTTDSRLFVEGELSLADERLALTARVQPKDFSPLALRAPLHIDGPLAAPRLALDRRALTSRALPAALLAMVHPLAALLPLIDPGEPTDTLGCRALLASLSGSPKPTP